MLQIVILICSTSLSPADCQKASALDVVVGPQASNCQSPSPMTTQEQNLQCE